MSVHLCGRCFALGTIDEHWTATNDQGLDASTMPDCILDGFRLYDEALRGQLPTKVKDAHVYSL